MKKRNFLSLVFLVLLYTLPTHTRSEEEFRVITEEGVPVAVNPGHPVPAKGGYQDIQFQEELTLGAYEGDPEYVFGDLIHFAVDDSGNIYVLDRRSQTVRKFKPSGAFELQLGKPGQGPGEFNFPEQIRILADGNLIIFDGEGQKFSVFRSDGSFVKSKKFLKLMFLPYLGFSSGNFIATHTQYETEKITATTGVFDPNSELVAPLHQLESKLNAARPSPGDQDARAIRLAETLSRAAFRKAPVIALNRDEDIFFGFSDKYEIKIYSAKVKLKRSIRTALPLLPVTKEDRQDYLNIWVPKDLTTWSTMGDEMRKKITSLIRFPEEKPAFLEIIPMDDDFLMALRAGEFNRKALIDIFDPQGRFIIEKVLPFSLKNGICRD